MFDNEKLRPFNEISTLISGLLKPLILVSMANMDDKDEAECIYYHKIFYKFPSSLKKKKKHSMRFKIISVYIYITFDDYSLPTSSYLNANSVYFDHS